jgi:hypothetical protein
MVVVAHGNPRYKRGDHLYLRATAETQGSNEHFALPVVRLQSHPRSHAAPLPSLRATACCNPSSAPRPMMSSVNAGCFFFSRGQTSLRNHSQPVRIGRPAQGAHVEQVVLSASSNCRAGASRPLSSPRWYVVWNLLFGETPAFASSSWSFGAARTRSARFAGLSPRKRFTRRDFDLQHEPAPLGSFATVRERSHITNSALCWCKYHRHLERSPAHKGRPPNDPPAPGRLFRWPLLPKPVQLTHESALRYTFNVGEETNKLFRKFNRRPRALHRHGVHGCQGQGTA